MNVFVADAAVGDLIKEINNPTPASSDNFGDSAVSTLNGNILVKGL